MLGLLLGCPVVLHGSVLRRLRLRHKCTFDCVHNVYIDGQLAGTPISSSLISFST